MKTIIAMCVCASACLMLALVLAVAGTMSATLLVTAGLFIALFWVLGILCAVSDWLNKIGDTDDVLKDRRRSMWDDS